MATKTLGTNGNNTLTALQWFPSGMSATDLATLEALFRTPVTGAYGAAAATSRGFIENGFLFLPDNRTPQGIQLKAGDWIGLDGAGWPIVVPNAIIATSWTHS